MRWRWWLEEVAGMGREVVEKDGVEEAEEKVEGGGEEEAVLFVMFSCFYFLFF